MKNGEIEPAGQVRSRHSGIEELFNFARDTADIREIAIVYSTMQEEVQDLVERLSARVSREHIRLARLGPALAVHAGPSILFTAVRGRK